MTENDLIFQVILENIFDTELMKSWCSQPLSKEKFRIKTFKP